MKRIFKYIAVVVAICLGFAAAKTVVYKLYPLDYFDLVSENAAKYDADPYLIMALIKAESNFESDAASYKGAMGLMQLTEDTAAWCAAKMGLTDYDLYNPETNIQIGTWYFACYLLEQFNGNVNLSVAAYNAGIGNVQKWLKNEQYSADGEHLDKIPYGETEAYVRRVNWNYKIYNKLYNA